MKKRDLENHINSIHDILLSLERQLRDLQHQINKLVTPPPPASACRVCYEPIEPDQMVKELWEDEEEKVDLIGFAHLIHFQGEVMVE